MEIVTAVACWPVITKVGLEVAIAASSTSGRNRDSDPRVQTVSPAMVGVRALWDDHSALSFIGLNVVDWQGRRRHDESSEFGARGGKDNWSSHNVFC